MFDDWANALDVSEYQRTGVDWGAARDAGKVRAVWQRCGYGTMYKDRLYDQYRPQIDAAGIPRGVYHFPLPHRSRPVDEYNAVMRYTAGDLGSLPWMIDMEHPPGTNLVALLGAQQLADWYLELGERLARDHGPGIAYVGAWFGMAPDRRLLGPYPYNWTANYGTAVDYATIHDPSYRPRAMPRCAGPWTTPDMVQHSGGNGRCPGFAAPVDLDIIHPETLRIFLNNEELSMADVQRVLDALQANQNRLDAIIAGEIHLNQTTEQDLTVYSYEEEDGSKVGLFYNGIRNAVPVKVHLPDPWMVDFLRLTHTLNRGAVELTRADHAGYIDNAAKRLPTIEFGDDPDRETHRRLDAVIEAVDRQTTALDQLGDSIKAVLAAVMPPPSQSS